MNTPDFQRDFSIDEVSSSSVKAFMNRVFGLMSLALIISGITASLVNWFMHSEQLDYIISCVGVLVFTGLTAYDVQRLKRIGMGIEYGTAAASKLAVMGALSLYLDFINLFIYLLRIFGNSRD